MGFCNWFCINKSGSPYRLYDADTNAYKGTIYNREAFVLTGGEGEREGIFFLNSSGKTEIVTIQNARYPYGDGFVSLCTEYPYSTEIIDGYRYYIFKMKQRMPIYTSTGRLWGYVAQNMYVATDCATVGENHKDWKLIQYVKQSSTNKWIPVSGDR